MSSNGEAAFPIAAVAIGLWSKFPEVGEHLLAHFYSVCPILIPMCVQKSKDMTDTDYMRCVFPLHSRWLFGNCDYHVLQVAGLQDLFYWSA